MKKRYFLLLVIILFGAFLRFFNLKDFPVQLNHDEVSQIYDTASIVTTGKDIYGKFLPFAFFSTGEYKVGHYIYISTIPYLIFGDREFTIRIPAALFGTLTILAVFLFINSLFKNWKLAFLSAALVSITPSEIFYSRKSFEGSIGVCLIFLGLFCLINNLDNLKSKVWGYIGLSFLTLAMYVYTSYTMIVPFLLLLFAMIFRGTIMAYPKKFVYQLLFWAILIIPLVYSTITNPGLRFRAATVLITQDVNLGRQLELSQNNIKTYIDYIFARFLNQFNPSYLFANGLDFTNQGLIGMGPLLFWQLPLLLIGVVFIIRSNLSSGKKFFIFGLAILPMIPSALTFEPFSPHRAMLSFAVMSIISAFGLYWLVNFVANLSLFNRAVKTMVFSLMFILFILNFAYFIYMYTVNLPYEKSQHIHYPFKQIAQFAWSQYHNFDQIIVDPIYGQSSPVRAVAVHYYLAYYGHYLPSKFQEDLKIEKSGMSFDKFSIREIDWRQDRFLKNTLIIASPWNVPINDIDKSKIMKRFNFYDGQLAFYAIKL